MPIDLSSVRVAFLAGTLGRGGAERQLLFMLRALGNEGVRCRVLCLTKGEAFEDEIRDLGGDVAWIGSSQNRLLRLRNFHTELRKEPVDVIQSVHFYTNIYAALAGRALRIPNIGAIRNDLHSEIAANGVFGRWQLRLPGRLIANSQLAVDRAVAAGIAPQSVHLLRNVVGDASVEASPRNNGTVNILFAGRLVPQKRPEVFLKLAAKLRTSLPHAKMNFTVAGDGPLRRTLEQQASQNGFRNSKVSFLGEQADMSEVYRKADVLVLTSVHEGTPNVVLEAMSHALPVVSTRVGGVPEILSQKCGVLVEPSDFSGLFEVVADLIRHPAKAVEMGRNGQEFVRKNHSISYLQEQLTGIYSQMLENGSAK